MLSDPHIEPIYYHATVSGWHHHHSEAGALVHLDEASGHSVDLDGRVVIFSAHLADHEELPNVEQPCRDDCEFAGLYPEYDPRIIREEADAE